MAIQLSKLLPLALLSGCSSFSMDVNSLMSQAEDCPGIVVFKIFKDGDEERISFVCRWENGEEEWETNLYSEAP